MCFQLSSPGKVDFAQSTSVVDARDQVRVSHDVLLFIVFLQHVSFLEEFRAYWACVHCYFVFRLVFAVRLVSMPLFAVLVLVALLHLSVPLPLVSSLASICQALLFFAGLFFLLALPYLLFLSKPSGSVPG